MFAPDILLFHTFTVWFGNVMGAKLLVYRCVNKNRKKEKCAMWLRRKKVFDCTYMVLDTQVQYFHVGSCLARDKSRRIVVLIVKKEERRHDPLFTSSVRRVNMVASGKQVQSVWKWAVHVVQELIFIWIQSPFLRFLPVINGLFLHPQSWNEGNSFHGFQISPKENAAPVFIFSLRPLFSLHPPDGLTPSLGHLTCPAHAHASSPVYNFPMIHFRQFSYLVSSPSSFRCEPLNH